MNENLERLLPPPFAIDYIGTDEPIDIYTEKEMLEFAALIVKECIDKIESKRSSGENPDQWTITRDMCYHVMMKELKEHFGIEE